MTQGHDTYVTNRPGNKGGQPVTLWGETDLGMRFRRGDGQGGSGEGVEGMADGSGRIWDARGKVEGHLVYRWRTNTNRSNKRRDCDISGGGRSYMNSGLNHNHGKLLSITGTLV